MEIRVLSDLHLEFGEFDYEYLGEDVVVLAGDIHVKWNAKEFILSILENPVKVIYVPGNHEYYGGRMDKVDRKWLEWALGVENFHYLNKDFELIDDVLFIGATLWTNLKKGCPMVENHLRYSDFNDLKRISVEDNGSYHKLTPKIWRRKHWEAQDFIECLLTSWRLSSNSIVVVTHHLPSFQSVLPSYWQSVESSALCYAYASELDEMILEHQPTLWIHGHTHHSLDYYIDNTRVVCNPRGYIGHEVNPDFNHELIVEV
jgi:predicted phosphodiesterase